MNRLSAIRHVSATALCLSTLWSASVCAAEDAGAFDKVQQINAGDLNIGYVDIGPRDGQAVILLHGWPYDIQSYAQVAPALAQKGYRVIVPYLRGYGSTRFLSAKTPRNGQPSAMAADIVHLMDALNIKQADFAGFDWGARTADIVAALWPQRVKSLVSVSGYLISSQRIGEKPLPPQAELSWWYQFYFATPRGEAGYRQNIHDFAKFIWHQASPRWTFTDATFANSAKALDNPDHVAVTISNYRWRLGLEQGEAKYAAYEQRLAKLPAISVPTITIEGENNGAPHPAPDSYRAKFTGKYEHRDFKGAVGHNPPQEAPAEFVQAVIDADRL
ncbi:alpha/beta hydrolase [Klebsiella aerogenes]|uniref:alpha/beta fold hydrolase n=1 Tax=Klebsiella aerogenes TaxID=548 RepID=UPI0007B3DBB9|nr:alpha/beta hydrolase [Klebsiella aerogenes]EKZ5788378.1 alpha/beta hydrolase [Klebsiella aerogenes]KZQ54006.1 alpha/beta hydrolase [Klebsiella aerogenes]RSW08473.1 alpha/beta hydrolase [Klebsiella aerogenes]HBV6369911.1 alpha/beta hydrolase [Klebsiella aerogenes]HCM7358301.1 alpha/beta hydrolase [Klebsiella aerogenes]